jgi:hypothetical protein
MFYIGTRSLLILRSNYQFKKNPTGLRKEFGFHRDVYQDSRNFSEQKIRFPYL